MSRYDGKYFNDILEQTIGVIINPAVFFRSMSKTGGYADPVIFLILMGVVAALIRIVLSFIGLGNIGMMATAGITAIIVLPIFLVIGGFISAAFAHLFWRALGSDEDYETAFRCMAYITAIAPVTALFLTVPYIGGILTTVWGMFLMIIASVETYHIARKKAQTWFGITGVILILFGLSSEYAARNALAQFEGFEDKSSEEMGRAMGEFLKEMKRGSE